MFAAVLVLVVLPAVIVGLSVLVFFLSAKDGIEG